MTRFQKSLWDVKKKCLPAVLWRKKEEVQQPLEPLAPQGENVEFSTFESQAPPLSSPLLAGDICYVMAQKDFPFLLWFCPLPSPQWFRNFAIGSKSLGLSNSFYSIVDDLTSKALLQMQWFWEIFRSCSLFLKMLGFLWVTFSLRKNDVCVLLTYVFWVPGPFGSSFLELSLFHPSFLFLGRRPFIELVSLPLKSLAW